MSSVTTEDHQTEYQTRYQFKIFFSDGEKEKLLTCYNLFIPFKDRDVNLKKSTILESPLPENSWEIVELLNSITLKFQGYMKELTSDYIDRHQFNFKSTNPNPNSVYHLDLYDEYAPVRDDNGKLTDKIEHKLLYRKTISATDFVYNPNFEPDFNPIWKDTEKYGRINEGIRSIIKKTFQKNKWTNRFKNLNFVGDCRNINTVDSYRW